MKNPRLGFAVLTVSIAACSANATTVRNDDFGSFNGARVELTEEGGIAAFATNRIVRHDDHSFSYVRRHICSTGCPAPLDTSAGTLSAAATDSLFGIVVAQSPFSLNTDYGATRGGADMIAYTLRVTLGQNTKTIRADDGTMPAQMRRIVEAVHGTIAAAATR